MIALKMKFVLFIEFDLVLSLMILESSLSLENSINITDASSSMKPTSYINVVFNNLTTAADQHNITPTLEPPVVNNITEGKESYGPRRKFLPLSILKKFIFFCSN